MSQGGQRAHIMVPGQIGCGLVDLGIDGT